MKVPNHIAIIMDGNGRWAKGKNLPRVEGHKQGLLTAENLLDYSLEKGIKFISLYVFSTENWKRPKAEITALFSLAEKFFDKFAKFCENKVRVVVSGNLTGLPNSLVKKIADIQQKTLSFDAICVNLCINYGGRRDIVEAVQKIVAEKGKITEENISRHLYNAFLPEPDLIIRTGGEMRISNFLLYQSAYAEFAFTKTLWPDFTREEYFEIIDEYCKRSRNFGGLKE